MRFDRPSPTELPGVAQVAMQQGTYAAQAIVQKYKVKRSFHPSSIFDKGSLAVIGRWAAVANVFGFHISGVAGVARMGVHPSDVHSPVRESHCGFHPLGNPRSDLQSRGTADYRGRS